MSTSLRSTRAASGPGEGRPRSASPSPRCQRRGCSATLRAHHVTHIDNFDGIVADRAILGGRPGDARRTTSAAGDPAASAEGRRAPTAHRRRPRAVHAVAGRRPLGRGPPRRRGRARGPTPPAAPAAIDYVVLVVPASAFGASVIVADTDADAEDVRFAVGPEAAANLIRRTDSTDPEMHGLELLAGPSVPFSSVAVIGVPNDKARHDGQGRARRPRRPRAPRGGVPAVVRAPGDRPSDRFHAPRVRRAVRTPSGGRVARARRASRASRPPIRVDPAEASRCRHARQPRDTPGLHVGAGLCETCPVPNSPRVSRPQDHCSGSAQPPCSAGLGWAAGSRTATPRDHDGRGVPLLRPEREAVDCPRWTATVARAVDR